MCDDLCVGTADILTRIIKRVKRIDKKSVAKKTIEKIIKNNRSLAGGPGFEPRLLVPETRVLPLNYPPILIHYHGLTLQSVDAAMNKIHFFKGYDYHILPVFRRVGKRALQKAVSKTKITVS